MTDAISSINSSSVSSTSSSSSSAVKEETKKKLKALGLDPSKYTTETQAQAALTQAQEAQAAKQQKPTQGTSEDTIKDEISSLAANIGVSVGTNDKIDDIMDKVSAKIDELTSHAGTDSTKKSEADNYQKQYTTIANEYAQMQAAKNMTGATAMANYAKFALGLS